MRRYKLTLADEQEIAQSILLREALSTKSLMIKHHCSRSLIDTISRHARQIIAAVTQDEWRHVPRETKQNACTEISSTATVI